VDRGPVKVLAAAGRVWAAAGLGRVIGITPSQSARNTLAAGVPESYNIAQFLGHLPGRRGARGPIRLYSGDVIVMDEASMVSNLDLADVIREAAASGVKSPAAACACSPTLWASCSSLSRSGSAPDGNRRRAYGSVPGTPPCWPSTTSMPGSPAVTRNG
jgi:AAA domain